MLSASTILPEQPGYRLQEILHDSARTSVYRAIRERDGARVVLKMPSLEADLRDLAHLRNERDILADLDAEGVVRLLGEERNGSRLVLVLADSGAVALRGHRPFAVGEFLELALRIARALATVHGGGITHRDINPSNIVFNPASRTVELIDFGIATALREADAEHGGTLLYMSPEQTGRMNRGVDYRTDFYSLGATWYELVVGEPPFVSGDVLELVHCHLARRPVPPCERDPAVGEGVSDLIMKLLEKDPDARYQSAQGLIEDLLHCLEHYTRDGAVARFALGVRDFSAHLRMPAHLYGRDQERAVLASAFADAARGHSRVVTVEGPAGVGKSTLVNDLRPLVAEAKGAWVSGKCDASHRNIPNFSLALALRQRVAQMLADSPASLEAWRAKLTAALGGQGALVVEVVPALEQIVGPQPALAELPPTESRNRRERVLINFVHALAATSPLVLFLDDLQWADPATMSLLEALADVEDGVSLLLVLGWRDDEIGEAHPLPAALAGVRSTQRLVLRDLTPADVTSLLVDTLACGPRRAAPLAAHVTAKTRGNPFFLRQFLVSLQVDGLLRVDAAERQWVWDDARIAEADITENVADLVTRRLRALPPETVVALQTAACVGSRFDLGLLSIALDRAPHEVVGMLRPALREGFVIAMGDGLDVFEAAVDASVHGGATEDLMRVADQASLQFLHDRVRQAAESMVERERAVLIHLALGRRLRDRLEPACDDASGKAPHRFTDDRRLFEVVSHLNEAVEHLRDRAEAVGLARLELEASRRAVRAAAHATALGWLEVARALLGESGWDRERELTLDIHLEAGVSASMVGDSAQVQQLVEIICAHARSPLESARALEVLMGDHIVRGRYPDALARGREALALLGVSVPSRPSRARLLLQVARTMVAITSVGIENIGELPLSQDPVNQQISSLIVRMGTASVLLNQELAPQLYALAGERTTRYGLTSASASAFTAVGVILIIALGQIDVAVRLAEEALRLADRFEDNTATARFAAQHMILHWKNPMHPIAEWTRGFYQRCLENGDFENGSIFSWAYIRMSYQCGVHLETLLAELLALSGQAERLSDFAVAPQWELQKLIMQAWRDASPRRGRVDLDSAPAVRDALEAKHWPSAWIWPLEEAFFDLAFERPEEALAHLDELEALLPGVVSLPELPIYHHTSAMVALAASAAMGSRERARRRRKAEKSLDKLIGWARHCPANHSHRVHMVQALMAQVDGNVMWAADEFERAAAAANANGFLQDEALALDLAGRFHLSLRRERLARTYLTDARLAWLRWGAIARARDLEERYPKYVSIPSAARVVGTATADERPPLDLMTVVKASRAISSEIMLPLLQQKLMSIAIENAGAQRGFLVLAREGGLTVEVDGDVDRQPPVRVERRPLDEAELAVSVVRYVARAQSGVVVDEAVSDTRFSSDPYVLARAPRSILCSPIVSQGKLVGVMYLENNRAASAFTIDRQRVLDVLSAQAAISYENARLYTELDEYRHTLEDKVRERTDELHVKNERLEDALRRLGQAQDQIVAQQKLAYLGTMAAGIAHEIKNPLNFVINFAQMEGELIDDLRGLMGEASTPQLVQCIDEIDETARKIREHGGRIDRVIKAMMLHAGASRGVKEPGELNGLVSQTIDLARHGATDPMMRAVEVAFSPDSSLPLLPMAARDVGRALLNVINNALQAAAARGGGGAVQVTTGREGDYALVSVRDNGVGIAPDVMDRIFAPFFTTRPSGQGTGLGLSISWDIIVGQHSGRLTATSTPGQGATFLVALPL